jgi:hypothetical protein
VIERREVQAHKTPGLNLSQGIDGRWPKKNEKVFIKYR